MIEVIPAILPKNYEDLKNRVALVRGVVPIVQIDISDGVFVPHMTWPFFAPAAEGEPFLENSLDDRFRNILNEQEGMPFWEDIDFELDLMVKGAVENFDIYTKLGPRRMIFHVEAMDDFEAFKEFLEGIDIYIRDTIEMGVAFGPNTEAEVIYPLVPFIDFVQVMGIDHEGVQGEEFDPKCLEHIKKLKEKFPDLTIGVDGGVNFDTASKIIAAGATCLVIGSAIFNTDDIIGTIERFKEL